MPTLSSNNPEHADLPAVDAPLRDWLAAGAFHGYAYSYPHKLAYAPFEKPISLAELWEPEDRRQLFLYVHVPYCEMRCGFCNLLTVAARPGSDVTPYLDALERQMVAVRSAVPDANFTRFAIGGGTPSFLELPELRRLFRLIRAVLGGKPQQHPLSFECSPATVDPEKLAFLREVGVDRMSMGVQSFSEAESRALGRSQRTAQVRSAIGMLQAADFPIVNLDLIYGAHKQTPDSWQESLVEVVDHGPEEIYLYPLYVRPLTGLDGRNGTVSDPRPALFRQGRDFLLANGYEQISMRYFRRNDAPAQDSSAYCCQEDGMIGLGPGARSYTDAVHYSTEYGVKRASVRAILEQYAATTAADFKFAHYGARLDRDEQRRRYLLKSLLRRDGLTVAGYQTVFGTDPIKDYPQLHQLFDLGLAHQANGAIQLTVAGLAQSDVVGPWLYSPAVRQQMALFDLA